MSRNRDAVDSGEDARFLALLLTVTEAGRNLLISALHGKDWKTRELVHAVAPARREAPPGLWRASLKPRCCAARTAAC